MSSLPTGTDRRHAEPRPSSSPSPSADQLPKPSGQSAQPAAPAGRPAECCPEASPRFHPRDSRSLTPHVCETRYAVAQTWASIAGGQRLGVTCQIKDIPRPAMFTSPKDHEGLGVVAPGATCSATRSPRVYHFRRPPINPPSSHHSAIDNAVDILCISRLSTGASRARSTLKALGTTDMKDEQRARHTARNVAPLHCSAHHLSNSYDTPIVIPLAH